MRTRLGASADAAGQLGAFEARVDFDIDDFQRRSMRALAEGRSVVVAAPTGAGKTLVAEFAVELCRASGLRALYTTPLKALSNQKFADFSDLYGTGEVGLLTGDHSIRPHAPVVVMTTEVLRNMLYADPVSVDGVGVVVLDEVHYLQDRYRGGVWEEVIIHLPPQVALVCLSATVSNAEEFAGWVETLRGDTEAVIEETRPVPLDQLYCVGVRDEVRLLRLFDGDDSTDPQLNPAITRLERAPNPRGRRARLRTPRRWEVTEALDVGRMLPAIYFVFSRRGCDTAVSQLMTEGMRLTTSAERRMIHEVVTNHLGPLEDDDLAALGYDRFLDAALSGIASHHAGMIPAFRETVEALFQQGLVKVVFATETLSLGVNMPARTVVIEKLTKFGGERHEPLTPGQYTQLTGRAGRRGIDASGNAVVLWSPYVEAESVAMLASTRTYELESSFRPTYNMAANLVARFDRDSAHRIVNSSFAQFRADKSVVRLEAAAARRRRAAAEYWAKAECERGDVDEYLDLTDGAGGGRGRPRVGSVFGHGGRPVVVVHTSSARARVVGADAQIRSLALRDLGFRLGSLQLPQRRDLGDRKFRRDVAASLEQFRSAAEKSLSRSSREARAHPVASCPEADAHMRWARRARGDEAEAERLERRAQRRTESLSRRFDAVCEFLDDLGYLDGWSLTSSGELLARVYTECDLLVAEALRSGTFDGLDAAEFAAVASVFTFEARLEGAAEELPAVRRVRDAVAAALAAAQSVRGAEEAAGLEVTRELDDGFCGQAYRWAAGQELDAVLADELGGGDFVRNVKQLVDLSRQVAHALAETDRDRGVGAAAAAAADAMWRGVVSVTGVFA
ncbi:MAG: DEAD/DEAH box helicase [Acidimicrobiia bacterium]|nr:DEAD/DEAH box helicase [Acidimicrobiia bacterium]